jgi:AcrR family transcriptional regulator
MAGESARIALPAPGERQAGGAPARTASQRARRDRIIQVAMALLNERAYERIQIREVADAADVSLATLYRYFRSKEQLYASVLLAWIGSYQAGVRTDVAGPDNPGERLRGALRRAVRAHERGPNFYRLIASLEVVTEPAVREVFTEFVSKFYGALGDAVERLPGHEAGAVETVASAVLDASLRQWALGRKSIRQVYADIDSTVDLLYSPRQVEEPALAVGPVAPSDPTAVELLQTYFAELISRYQQRRATTAEIREAMIEDPSDDLLPSTGVLLMARRGGVPLGCIGMRYLPDRVGQVTRMFVVPGERRQGLGFRLLAEVECLARQRGLGRLELDTRDDLVEARRLYLRFGFDEVPAFNAGRYAEHWFAKRLDA